MSVLDAPMPKYPRRKKTEELAAFHARIDTYNAAMHAVMAQANADILERDQRTAELKAAFVARRDAGTLGHLEIVRRVQATNFDGNGFLELRVTDADGSTATVLLGGMATWELGMMLCGAQPMQIGFWS